MNHEAEDRLVYFTDTFLDVLKQKGWSRDAYYELGTGYGPDWWLKVYVLPKDKKVENRVDTACLAFAREIEHEAKVESEVSYERLTAGTYIVVELCEVNEVRNGELEE